MAASPAGTPGAASTASPNASPVGTPKGASPAGTPPTSPRRSDDEPSSAAEILRSLPFPLRKLFGSSGASPGGFTDDATIQQRVQMDSVLAESFGVRSTGPTLKWLMLLGVLASIMLAFYAVGSQDSEDVYAEGFAASRVKDAHDQLMREIRRKHDRRPALKTALVSGLFATAVAWTAATSR